jgi:hypothetical protein
MDWKSFDEAVGRAMRRNDQGENEFISKAAAGWRANTVEKLKDAAIEAKLLPPDITIQEAASYFSRVYNTEKIIAQDVAFKERVLPWMREKMQASFDEHHKKLVTKFEQLRADMEDLKLDKEGRLGALGDIDAKMAELANTYRGGFEVDQEIKSLRKKAAKTEKEGNKAEAETIRKQAKDMEKDAAEYRDAVAPYLRRRRVVERGTGNADRKIEKIQDQLVKLEEANLTSLRRLVAKGRWFERELGSIGTEKQLAEKISDLKDTFAQVAKQFDDGSERIRTTREKFEEGLKKVPENATEVPANDPGIGRIKERLNKFENGQQRRTERLSRLAERLETAENIDIVALKAEVKAIVENLVEDISSMTLGRGERAARLMARMEKLDPAKVAEQIKAMEAAIARQIGAFDERWGTKMLGKGVDELLPVLQGIASRVPNGPRIDFDIAAREAVDEIFDAITGKGNLTDGAERAEWRISPRRGPLKDRTFHIPDEMIEDFLNSSARQVNEIMSRRMAGQIALQERFGSTTLEPQLIELKKDYDRLQKLVGSAESYQQAIKEIGQHYGFAEKLKNFYGGFERNKEGLKLWLDKELKNDIADIQGLRDLILGRYKPDQHSSNWGRALRSANQINYIRLSGKFLLASLVDMYRAPMMQGLARSLGTLPAMLSKQMTSDGVVAKNASIREAKLAGLVSETMLHSKMASIAELGDPFAHGNRAERFIENLTRVSTKWNGMALWQDWLESWTSVTAQNNMIEAIQKIGKQRASDLDDIRAGKKATETLTENDRWLAMLNVDRNLSGAIERELAQHAEKVGGVWVANTEKWTNQNAVKAYRNALSKEVTRTIIRPGQGDVPLFFKTPLGQGLFQFRSFMLSAHQRIMLAGLQESSARFLSGLIGMTTIGMAVSYLKALGNGKDALKRWEDQAKNPMYLLGEGIDNSGLFPLFFELSNTTEKVTKASGAGSFNPIKSPLKAMYDGKWSVDSQKTWNIPAEQAVLGPLAGMGSAFAKAAGVAYQGATGQEVTKGEFRQGAGAMLFNTHVGLGQLIQFLNDDLPYTR